MDAYLGIDVGTGSARAGVFDHQGHLLGTSTQPIRMWRPQPDFVEQSSVDIWRACCTAVREAVEQAAVNIDQIRGRAQRQQAKLILPAETIRLEFVDQIQYSEIVAKLLACGVLV